MSEDQLLCKVAELEAEVQTVSGVCDHLTKCLEQANKNHEHYERLYYLEKQKNEAALELIERFGGIDGAHHKQWVLDQIVRAITGDKYDEWVEEMRGEYDEVNEMYEYCEWDEGIAP